MVVGVDVVGDRGARLERLRELDDVVRPDGDEDAAAAQELVLALVQHLPADHVDVHLAGPIEGARRQA